MIRLVVMVSCTCCSGTWNHLATCWLNCRLFLMAVLKMFVSVVLQLLVLSLVELNFGVCGTDLGVDGHHVEREARVWYPLALAVQHFVEDHGHGGGHESRHPMDQWEVDFPHPVKVPPVVRVDLKVKGQPVPAGVSPVRCVQDNLNHVVWERGDRRGFWVDNWLSLLTHAPWCPLLVLLATMA